MDNDVTLAKVTPTEKYSGTVVDEWNRVVQRIVLGVESVYLNGLLCRSVYFRSLAISNMTGTGGLQRIPKDFVKNFEIPVPDIKTQHAIVSSFESEQKLVDANRQLITIYEQKIKDRIDRLWSEKEVFN